MPHPSTVDNRGAFDADFQKTRKDLLNLMVILDDTHEKFRLFDGVFGASDEVLGALESGVDIERRIADVYQNCRTNAEIQTAFDALQAELDAKIQARLAATRQALMENFDEDVRSRLKISREKTLECLSQRERWLLALTRVELDGQAQFDPQMPRFLYSGDTAAGVRQGWYNLDWKAAETHRRAYELNYPLLAVMTEPHSGELSPEGSFVDVKASPGVMVSAIKQAEAGSGLIVRLYEQFGQVSRVDLTFPRSVIEANETDLLERAIGGVKFDGPEVRTVLAPFEIKTLFVRLEDL